MMDLERFVKIVEQEGALTPDEADNATRATFETLSERLSKGQARHLVEQLPGSGPWLFPTRETEPIDYDEFLARVARRAGTDVSTAERYARAVFAGLGRALTADELAGLVADLPQDFAPVLAEAQHLVDHTPRAEDFFRRVAALTGLDADGARRATDAVLETLAERIAGGEVDDLISALPVPLHSPLKRGKRATSGVPRRLSRETFVSQVADREGVPAEAAFEHVRAVFAALRDTLPEAEFWDVTVELPPDFGVLLPVPHEP
jgi:uncharacterized protein (DUF2267 family)